MSDNKPKSLKALRNAGTVKSRDLYRIRYKDLVVVPGNNERDEDQRFWDSIDELEQFILDGGPIPPLEIRINPTNGAVEIVQGHRRHLALGRTIPAKQKQLKALKAPQEKIDELEWVDCLPFTGNDVERIGRIFSGNNHLPMTEVETSRGYKRLQSTFGLDSAAIAKLVGKPRAHVELHLGLANANHQVQQAVKAGKVSATEAVKAVKKHGDEAGDFIEKQHVKAVSQGKTKVTSGTIKGPSLPRAVIDDMEEQLGRFMRELGQGPLRHVEEFRAGNDQIQEVVVPVTSLIAILAAYENLTATRAEQEMRLAAKLAKKLTKVAEEDEL